MHGSVNFDWCGYIQLSEQKHNWISKIYEVWVTNDQVSKFGALFCITRNIRCFILHHLIFRSTIWWVMYYKHLGGHFYISIPNLIETLIFILNCDFRNFYKSFGKKDLVLIYSITISKINKNSLNCSATIGHLKLKKNSHAFSSAAKMTMVVYTSTWSNIIAIYSG